MNVTKNALFKRVSYFTLAFVLAVSTLTAAVPFILSEKASAIAATEVDTKEELKAALADETVDYIQLSGNISSDEELLLNRSGVTIQGNDNTITFTGDAAGWQGNYVFQVFNATGVTLNSLRLTGGDAGLLVNGSSVTLTGHTHVGGNEFGGIEVSSGANPAFAPTLTVPTYSSFSINNSTEVNTKPTVWVDGAAGTVNTNLLTLATHIAGQKQFYLNPANTGTVATIAPTGATFSTLQAAFDAATTGQTVTLNKNVEIAAGEKAAVIKTGITFNGNNHSITTLGERGLVGNEQKNAALIVERSGVTVQNLTVQGISGTNASHGIIVFSSDNVTLKNIVARNNASGVVVSSSKVAINTIATSGNAWNGINVDKPGAVLSISGTNTHADAGIAPAIWVDNRAVGQVIDAESKYNKVDVSIGAAYVLDTVAPTVSWQKQPNAIYKANEGFHVRPITDEEGMTKSVYIDSVSPANLVWSLTSEHKNFDTTNANNPTLWNSLADGTHKFIAVFADQSGNSLPVDSNTFVIDRTAPTVKVNLNRASFLANNGTTSKIQVPEIEALDTNLTRIEVWKSGSKVTEWTNVAQGVTTRKKIDWLGEGTYTVRAFDAAGNVSSDFTVTIDNTAPVAPQSYNPSNGGWNTNNAATFVWKNVSDADRYEIRYSSFTNRTPNANNGQLSGSDATNFAAVKSAGDYSNYTVTAPLADGNWFWQVRAIDAYGNVGEWGNIWSTKIDTTAPTAPVVVNANVFVKIGQVNKDLAWTESQTGVVKYEYREYTSYSAAVADTAYWQKTINAPSLSTSDTASLTSTVLYWRVVAIDVAGNRSALSDIGKITIDREAPTASPVTFSTTSQTNQPVIATLTVSEEVSAPEGWTAADASNKVFTKSYAANVDQTVTFTDLAGNTGETQVAITWIDTAAPVAEVAYSTQAPTNQPVIATISTNEPIETPAGWAQVEGSNQNFTKSYAANATETVSITDLAGNTTEVPVSITWIDITAPVITSATANGATTRGIVGFTVNDADATVRVNGVVTTASQVSGDGTYTVVATDTVGNVSTSFTFTINNAQAITFNTIDLETATPLISGTALWVVDPASVETVTVTIDGTPYAATIDAAGNWSVQVVEPLANGAHTITVNGVSTTFTTALPTTFNAPAIVSPAAAVLGDATQNNAEQNNGSGETGVQGANTAQNLAAADTDLNKGLLFGLAWYWWILILAALTALAWWIIGAIRRRREEQN